MTDDERKRLAALEKTTQGFNLVTNRINVQGGFNQLRRNATDSERLAHLEQIHENFTIVGGNNVTVEGSLRTGYAICSTCPDAGGQGQGQGPVINLPPTPTGACCDDEGNCTVTSLVGCANSGGTYQGDGTDCDPNPCPEPPGTGACCTDGFECIPETTEEECNGLGGVYQGNGSDCDPNPCCPSPCPDWGGFIDDPPIGKRWATRTLVTTITTNVTGPDDYFCNLSWNTTTIARVDPDTCEITMECSGSIEWTGSDSPGSISETWTLTDCFGTNDCCKRIPTDSIPGCAGDVGACNFGYNSIPVWPDHGAGWSVSDTEASITGSSSGTADGYTWDCDASTTDTLTDPMFGPCE